MKTKTTYFSLKSKLFFLLVLIITAVTVSGCSEVSDGNPVISNDGTDVLAFVSQKLGIDSEAAEAVLAELANYGPTDEISYIVKSLDIENGEEYYVVWMKNGSFSLYMDRDMVSAIVKGAGGKPSTVTTSAVTTVIDSTSDVGLPESDNSATDTTADPDIDTWVDIPFVPDGGETSDVTSNVETTEPTETTASEDTASNELVSVYYSKEIERGSKGYFGAKGTPGATYRLDVIYPSGKSSAKGLGSQTADSKGNLYWEWTVASSTSLGTHKIVLTYGKTETEYSFKVIPKSGDSNDTTTVKPPSSDETIGSTVPSTGGYVVNTSSKKFHLPTCRYAISMSDANRSYVENRAEAVKMGYVACKVCKP